MNRRVFLTASSIVSAALLQAQSDEGFNSLFDGKTLSGWSIQEGPESAFYVSDRDIVAHESSTFPAWLRSDQQYENFDFRCEFFVKGWTDCGIFLHAPEHGRNAWTGMMIKIFHQRDEEMRPQSMGSIFPVVPPLRINVRNQGEWNTFRALMNWPRLKIWVNDEAVQDLDLESVAELRYRLRRGYLGLEALSYPIRFRNLRIKELPPKENWEILYESPEDVKKWRMSESNPRSPARFEPLGNILWATGLGHLATLERYTDFELNLYIRAGRLYNGGILFRSSGEGLHGRRHYEIQLFNSENSHYPTGSLYHFKRAVYPRVEDEKWYLMQLIVQGKNCVVRINGENVLEYDRLEDLEEGHVELQAHRAGAWAEFKHIRIKRI